MDDGEFRELCHRFFDAIEQRDYETLESCYAPEAVVWHSHDMLYQPRADNLAMLKRGMESGSKTRFKDRRVRAFEGGFVQQHTIHVTRADGFEGQMEVCFIGYVRDGMISRAYEYFDTGQIEKFIGPLPEKTKEKQ
jgi:ketosteroid isomerase-like protein